MTTMTIQVPDALEQAHEETVRLIAAKLYEAGKLDLRQAAEMCNMKKWDFLEVLASYNVSFFQYSVEEIIADAKRIA
jgi:predicted HTH domain antitoxin